MKTPQTSQIVTGFCRRRAGEMTARKMGLCVAWLVALLSAGSSLGQPIVLSSTKAELMGRVEDFFMNNFRDVTSRKSMEWGEVDTDGDGNRSIRYMYVARIWDTETMVMNTVFTFAKDGTFVRFANVEGFPRKKNEKIRDVTTQNGMIDLVDDFFEHNFRDICKRDTIEWGQVSKDEKGNSSIRYKYRATLRDGGAKAMDQVFTFDSNGKFVSVTNAEEPSKNP